MTKPSYMESGLGVLLNSNPVEVSVVGKSSPITVWVSPESGDTVRVEYKVSPGAPWRIWDKGDVTTYADDVTDGPVGWLRFTRTDGTGTTSAYGVL